MENEPVMQDKKQSSTVVWILLVIILLVALGLWIAGTKNSEQELTNDVPQNENTETPAVQQASSAEQPPLSSSDETFDIESDLNATSYSELDSDLNQLN